jgi:type III pantothenate kinase
MAIPTDRFLPKPDEDRDPIADLDTTPYRWLAVAQGNTRLMWGSFEGDRLVQWQHCRPDEFSTRVTFLPQQEVWIASVTGTDREDRMLAGLDARLVRLADVPLTNTYKTLGLDRALALAGAARLCGWPVLVLDGGTALTVSAADGDGAFAGGAILPGLGLQGRSLHEHTDALPLVSFTDISKPLPPRWACTTPEAIRSGILCTVLAGLREFCQDWRDRYPRSPVIVTGGDGALLYQLLQWEYAILEPAVVLYGIATCRDRHLNEFVTKI